MIIVNLTPNDVIVEVGDARNHYAASGSVAYIESLPPEALEPLDDGTPLVEPQMTRRVVVPFKGHVDAIIVSMSVAEEIQYQNAVDFHITTDLSVGCVRVFVPDSGCVDANHSIIVRRLIEYESLSIRQ